MDLAHEFDDFGSLRGTVLVVMLNLFVLDWIYTVHVVVVKPEFDPGKHTFYEKGLEFKGGGWQGQLVKYELKHLFFRFDFFDDRRDFFGVHVILQLESNLLFI